MVFLLNWYLRFYFCQKRYVRATARVNPESLIQFQ